MEGSRRQPVALGNLFAFLLALPLMPPLQGHGAMDWSILLYLGVVQIGVAYALLTRAIPHVPALETSLLLFLEPALNPILAWLVHGEFPGPWAIVGGVIIMISTGARSWFEARGQGSTQSDVVAPTPLAPGP